MKELVISVPFAIATALALCARGNIDLLALWNCVPVVAAWIAFSVGLRAREPVATALVVGSLVSLGLSTLLCLAWLFNWRGLKTISNAGFVFALTPVVVSAVAAAAGLVAWRLARRPGR